MIKSAIIKLTLWYLGIVMVLSVGFSVALYQLYKTQLLSDLGDRPAIVKQLFDIDVYHAYRLGQLDISLEHMRQNLTLLNVAMLVVGGTISYALARRTLQPVADALEAQTRFTADASHELRTPLTAMQTEIEVALRNEDLTKAQAKGLLQSNLEEVAKLKALSEGLLTLAQSNGKELKLANVSLEEVTVEAVNRLIPAAQAKQITVTNNVRKARVKGDKASLTELLTILVDNAIKYSSPKSTITLSSQVHGKVVHLHVADNGDGIKAADLPRIFDRFYRADTSRTKGGNTGYGLGLSIARKIVEAHNGGIDVKSTVGSGSTFTVRLPQQ